MQTYLAAHDEFVAWLDGLVGTPSATEIDSRLLALARCAADRGMTETHWTFVIDGLVAHAHRRSPDDVLLSSSIARGFGMTARWSVLSVASIQAMTDVCARRAIG